MKLKFTITVLVAMFISGCGGGGGSDTSTEISSVTTPKTPSSGYIILSGKITYDLVPVDSDNIGLDYDNIRQEAVKGVQVDAIDSSNQSVTSTFTDAAGNYSLSVPNNTEIKIRVLAKMVKSGASNWDVKVVDNTNSSALYVMEGALTSTGLNDSTRNLNASSGWSGNSYTSSRVAAPFAILDNAYQSIQKVLAANPNTVFPPLLMNWSTQNVSSANYDPSSGQILTSHYSDSNLFILGDADSDTDEYDDHIITHEWGHYYEDKLSRSDSIGGPHSNGELLDIRVAFGEGFGNAFSGMVLDEPVYFDTLGASQAGGFSFNLENEAQEKPGWYSEASVQRILYDLYDDSSDGSDILSLGFAPLHNIFTGAQKTTPAFTSIFSFIKSLKDENMGDADDIDSIVSSESIAAITDIYGTGRINLASELPNYVNLNLGSTVNVCPTYTYGTRNKLGNHQYIRLNIDTAGNYTIKVSKSNSAATTDPDFLLYNVSLMLSLSGTSGAANSEERTVYLNEAIYKLDISDYNNVSGACFDVTVN